jgi:hypothetical protein
MSALIKRIRTGFQAGDKLTFRMRQTLVQSTTSATVSRMMLDVWEQTSLSENLAKKPRTWVRLREHGKSLVLGGNTVGKNVFPLIPKE